MVPHSGVVASPSASASATEVNAVAVRAAASSSSLASSSFLPNTSSMDNFLVKTSASKKHKLDVLITAKYFYASNTAFRQVESHFFLKLMAGARHGYKPPNRKQLAGPLLDKVYANVEKELQASLSTVDGSLTRPITILQDGWSSIRNDPLLAKSIHTGSKSYLLCAKDCGAEKNAEFCFFEAD